MTEKYKSSAVKTAHLKNLTEHNLTEKKLVKLI